jgi:cell division protein FtsI/penicillin-binding protein 2
MDPKTGEILAMATNPRFNPNNPGEAYELEKVTYSKYPNPQIDLL